MMNSTIMLKRPFYAILLALLLGCSGNSSDYSHVLETYSHLEYHEVDISSSNYKIISQGEFQFIEDSSRIGFYFAADFGDSLVVVTDHFKSFVGLELEKGVITSKLTRLGKGPGEYGEITDLEYDKNKFIVFDGLSSKIITYNRDLEVINETFRSSIHPFQNISYREPYLAYSDRVNVDNSYELENMSSGEIKSLHRRLIPIGMQPQPYNRGLVSLSSSYDLTIVSGNLPFIFEYNVNKLMDNELHGKIVRLLSQELELINTELTQQSGVSGKTVSNPPPFPVERQQDTVVEVTPLFQDVATDRDWILVKQLINNRLLVLKKVGGSFRHHGSYQFKHDSGHILKFRDISFYYPWIYLGSSNGIIRININSLN